MGAPDLVIVSNRGPLSFAYDDEGALVTARGAGGLVSSLGPAVADSRATWVAAAISGADREAAANGVVEAEGFRLRSLVIDDDAYRQFYDVIANATLWFMHHDLWDLPRRPRFDRHWRAAWDAYREVNHAFAAAVADDAPEGATVLVQDYHLSLLGDRLAQLRPDVRTVHFHHTPFADPNSLRVLPHDVATELMRGLTGHTACGFHCHRWAAAFATSTRAALGREARTFVARAAPDADDLRGVAGSAACGDALRRLEERVGDRKLIVRVDRIELSKNILRGFHAFEDLLETRPEWRERVVFAANVYPSREGLLDYQAYRLEVEGLVARINERWGTPGWDPILLDTGDDFPRSVAALRRYDVLLVNPVKDGLNLVALEGPLVNERDGVLVLSTEAGVWEEVGGHAMGVNPFDVAGTADALARALDLPAGERVARSAALRRAATNRTAGDWLAEQLAAGGHE